MLLALALAPLLSVALAEEPPVRPAPPPAPSAALLDVDYVDADLHAVLRSLAEAGGVNLVVGDDVQGTVTIHLVKVTWEEAFAAVLMQKGLAAVPVSTGTVSVERRPGAR